MVFALKINCFFELPPASRVRLPVRLAASVGNVYAPGLRVRPPRFDDVSAIVGVIDTALDYFQVSGCSV